MPTQSTRSKRGRSARNHRAGRVTVYLRRNVWYLYYSYRSEQGRRVRRRMDVSLRDARRLGAQIKAQLATGAPAMLSFEPVSVVGLRQRWLDHHEHVLRSSIATIRRYRAATDHLVRFAQEVHPISSPDRLTLSVAEAFA